MTRELVFVHGRGQDGKDPGTLKAEWIEALEEGLAKSGLTLPIREDDVRFPFYGDTLRDMVGGRDADDAAKVIVRGEGSGEESDDERRFIREVMEEVRQQAGLTEEQVAAVLSEEYVLRGPENWGWFQRIVEAIDRYVPFGSGAGVALATRDVYRYLRNSAIREHIQAGVGAALTPGTEAVVVAHSLGSVVAYDLLRREGHLRGWKVPLLVTVGSPLAVTRIRNALRGVAPLRTPECVGGWVNAMDHRDIVSLYPLEPGRFPVDPPRPAIENFTDVRNRTSNRHGIAGYLDDDVVARRIHAALTA